jgi:hypothetical protein
LHQPGMQASLFASVGCHVRLYFCRGQSIKNVGNEVDV